jgi:hypothetical protein
MLKLFITTGHKGFSLNLKNGCKGRKESALLMACVALALVGESDAGFSLGRRNGESFHPNPGLSKEISFILQCQLRLTAPQFSCFRNLFFPIRHFTKDVVPSLCKKFEP